MMSDEAEVEIAPRSPLRLTAFADFFKSYMSISALVTAALPIPTTALKLIPTYAFQTKALATLTSLFCFLTLAFVFYSRHKLAQLMFPEHFQRHSPFSITGRIFVRLLPLQLIVASLLFMFFYLKLLIGSVVIHRAEWGLTAQITDAAIMETSYQSQVPEATLLMVYYLGFFMTAVCAFTLMALKEYLQDLLGLSELAVIKGPVDSEESTD